MRSIHSTLLAIMLLAPLPVLAAGSDGSTPDKSSTVDPAGQKATAPDAHPASPGTVGAMDGTEAKSFTATKSDQGKAHLK